MSAVAVSGLSRATRQNRVGLGCVAVWLLAIGVFFSGVLVDPRNPERVTKLVLADAFLVSGATLYLLSLTNRHGVFVIPISAIIRLPVAILIAFIFWIFLSATIANLFHGAEAKESIQTFSNYVYGAVIFFVVAASSASDRNINLLINAYLLGVMLVAGISVFAMFGMGPEWAHHGAGRIKSTTQSVNQLSAHVAPGIPLALILCLRRRTPWRKTFLYMAIVALSLLALVATGSRTALALAIFSAVPIIVAYALFFRQRISIALAGAMAVIAALLGLAYLVAVFLTQGVMGLPEPFKILARPLGMVSDQAAALKGLAPRLDQTIVVWRNWAETPVFGVGPGNFKNYFSHYHEVHNSYFATLIEAGVPAILLLLSFISVILYRSYFSSVQHRLDPRSVTLFAAATGFLSVTLYGMGSFGLRQRPFWILAGFAVGALNLKSRRPGD